MSDAPEGAGGFRVIGQVCSQGDARKADAGPLLPDSSGWRIRGLGLFLPPQLDGTGADGPARVLREEFQWHRIGPASDDARKVHA